MTGRLRRLRRAVTGTGRRVRPPRGAVLALAAVVLGTAALAFWGWHWATRSASPARTLGLAAAVSPDGVRLDSALEVTWTWSVGGTAALEDRWRALVAPELPPGICVAGGGVAAGDGAGGTSGRAELDQALRQLDQAVTRSGTARAELERRIVGLRGAGSGVSPGGRADFLVRYGLARGYGAAGDWAMAADVLEPVFDGWVSSERVPDTNRERARGQVATGRVDEDLATEVVHARYLAGTIAYHRGEAERAVDWFRRSINAVHYLLAARGEDGLSPEGHYQRVAGTLGEARCPGARADEALTSLDAYAGLVAAYMADDGFRDPRLVDEVRRGRLQIDPGDPFVPVLQHARVTRGDPARTPIPENLLWAASNLQRVYHHNRLRPDPRLEVTRAVLLLHLTRDSTWAGALRADGGANVCAMLGGLADDLHADAAALELDRPGYGPPDSARAAVAVQTFARLDRGCAGAGTAAGVDVPRVDPAVRSAWIRLGGGYLTRGLGSTYESLRTELAAALDENGASPQVVEDRVTPPLERARSHLAALRDGRVPPEMPADLPVPPVRRFVEEWWSAVFADVAATLVDRTRPPEAGEAAPSPLRAGEVEDYLLALESAVDHAGLRPRDVYATGELAPLAAAGGSGAELAWRIRTAVRNQPWLTAGLLTLGVGALALLALLVHVSVWRYRMFTTGRFFAAELDGARAAGRAA